MTLVLALVFLIALIACAAFLVVRYRQASGSRWERLLATARDSATVLWGYVVAAGGLVVNALTFGADALNQPELRDAIQSCLKPEAVGVAMLAIAAVTVLARMRTLGTTRSGDG